MVDDDDGDGFPSLETRTDSKSALPREIRAWWRLHIVKRDESFSMIFSPRKRIYGVGVEVGGPSWDPQDQRVLHRGWARPPPFWTGCGSPLVDSFANIFYSFQNVSPWSFRSFRELLFLHKNNTMAILLKTSSVRVSFIQIMQVRVQSGQKCLEK